ncbi:MAG: CotH kinase family protein [Bacteroidetes bacterium]|nr:CotH kinase family protein [Bacteroidota bacterium]
MKIKYALLLLFAAGCSLMNAQFKFNEYSCSNTGQVANTIGAGIQVSPNWVELMNISSNTQQLSGWFISNDRNNLTKYQVPFYNNSPIKVDSFSMFVILLDTYDKTTVASIGTQTLVLHTNFQVYQTYISPTTNTNTVIYLSRPPGTAPYDSIVIQRVRPSQSWGKPNSAQGYLASGGGGLNQWKLYKTPTPGAKNPTNPSPITTTRNWYNGYTPTPKFSVPAGYVSSSTQINLNDTTTWGSTNPNFEIFYTTDCTTPTYTAPTAQSMGVGSGGGTVTMPIVTPGSSPAYVGVVVRGLIHDQSTPQAYLDGFEAYGGYIQDSLYHMNVLCTCIDTNSLFITHSKDTVPAVYSYISSSSKKEIYRNQGQALVKKLDFYNPATPRQQWQFQFRAEDKYGYHYSNLYPFFSSQNILGISPRSSFPEFVVRSASVDNFLPPGTATLVTSGSLPGYGYAPNHVRDFYNHSITLRHKLNFESSHYTPTYVFINGMNKGIYYIKELIDTNYTQYYYNYAQATIIANDLAPNSTTPQIKALSGSLSTWNNWYSTVMQASYNVHQPGVYKQIGDSLDIASFIDYNFYNMFSVNTDFVKTQALWWKGIADTSNHTLRKWRFGLSNTDMTWGFMANNTGIADYTPTSSPCDYINAFGSGANNQYPLMPLFYKLMANDTFKSAFLSRYQDLLNTSYSCDTLTQHLSDIRALIKQDMPSQVWWYQPNPAGACTGCDSVKLWNNFLDSMNLFLTQRCSLAVQGLKNCYNLNGPYNVCVDAAPQTAGQVKLNTITIQNFIWNGKYLDSVITTAIAIPDSNYVFDHWVSTYSLMPNQYSDTVTFYVTNNACIQAVFKLKPAYQTYGNPMLPTAFTPNGDGNNDIMNIYGIANATSYEFEVYNRWGERVFHSLDKTQGWDGNYNGNPAPVGLYAYWYNIVIDGKTYNQKGNFTLLR